MSKTTAAISAYGDFTANYTRRENSEIVIFPFPYEKSTTYLKGTSKAPSAIIKASKNLEFYDEETSSEVFKRGIYTHNHFTEKYLDSLSEREALDQLEHSIPEFLDKFLVFLGGEHSITAGMIPPFLRKYPDLSILHFDAHADLRNSYLGSKYSHACVMRRIVEDNKLHDRLVQVGIRALDTEEAEYIKENKIKTFYKYQINNDKKSIEKIIGSLSDNVFISFDFDALDLSLMPATGTPEPDGFTWNEVFDIFRLLIDSGKKVVGADFVEFMPLKNIKAYDFLAAKLVYKFLSLVFSRK